MTPWRQVLIGFGGMFLLLRTVLPPFGKDRQLRKRLPDAIIIGGRKCGTRALLDFLSLHPDVRIAPTELHFFDRDENYATGESGYLNLLPDSADTDVVIEKTPRYFVKKDVPQRVFEMVPNVKLILILRDPVLRTISDHTQVSVVKATKGKAIRSLSQAILTDHGQIDTSYKPIKNSLYYLHLLRWFRLFPLSSLHIVDGDKFISDPYPELKAVERFIGLTSELSKNWFYYNKTKGFFCARKDDVPLCLGDTKGRPHVNVSQRTKRRLRKFFEPYNAQFFNLVNKSFTW